MSDIAIRVDGLGKQYRIGRGGLRVKYKTLREQLVQTAGAPFRAIRTAFTRGNGATRAEETIWALKDVSFEVKRGEVLGIIGRNGAGKSTLLKILSRITEPTTGYAEVHGRVGSLLEVGTGFHPELSGRENIYLNGAILGMRRGEIDRKFDEMVAFAEVEKFIDTPVKHYSSGMYLRLAFAVAAHLEPEILLVDEVLAVGDFAFQNKCMGKMSEVAKGGRTILFVTHNMVAMQRLCTDAVWLDDGTLGLRGEPSLVASSYLQKMGSGSGNHVHRRWDDPARAPGNAMLWLQSVRISATDKPTDEFLTIDTPLELSVEFWNNVDNSVLHVGPHFYNEDQICVFASASQPQPLPSGLIRFTCQIPSGLLNAGRYSVSMLVTRDVTRRVIEVKDALQFQLFETERDIPWSGKWPGVIRPKLLWKIEIPIISPGIN